MNAYGSQLSWERRALVSRVSSILVREPCLLAQDFNSFEFLKGGVLRVLAVYAFLALFDVWYPLGSSSFS